MPRRNRRFPGLVRSDRKNYGSVRFSRDGQILLVITGNGFIETIDAHSGALRLKICCSSIYGDAALTPDGEAIANAGHWPRLWDAHSGQLLGPLARDREFSTFRPISFGNSRNAVLMGSQDGRVYVWDLENRRLVATSPPQPAYVDRLTVSKAGWIIYAGFGKMVTLWNLETGQLRFMPSARPTSNLVLGSDGASILFGTARGEIEFWDIGRNNVFAP